MKTTTLLKAVFITAVFISLSSCGTSASDDAIGGKGTGSSSSSIGGSYHIISMMSDINVDLNNDGFTSNDLLTEIDPSFFDPKNPELTIKPVIYNSQVEEIMTFVLPHSNVISNAPGAGSVKFTRNGLGFVYNFDENTQTININNGSQTPGTTGVMESVIISGKNMLQAVFQKDYYDFSTKKWQLLTITCTYRKV